MISLRTGLLLLVGVLAACGAADEATEPRGGVGPTVPARGTGTGTTTEGEQTLAEGPMSEDEGAPGEEGAGTSVAVEPDVDGSEADPEVESMPEAPVAARCDRTKPFDAPKLVAGLNTDRNETAPRLTSDELGIFFMRQGTSSAQIVTATRTELGGAWSAAVLVKELSSSAHDGSPSLTADGLTMYFHSNRSPSSGSYDIWRSVRASKAAPWGTPTRLSILSSAASDTYPYVRPDGRALYFSSLRSGHYNVYVASVDAAGKVAEPRGLGNINTEEEEASPVPTADGLALYFMRRGTTNDIWVSRRTKTSDSWGAPRKVLELSSTSDERPSWVSTDECLLYLTSTGRPGSVGGADLYVAQRMP